MVGLRELQEYFSKEVPAEAPESVREMINVEGFRFDSYYLLSRALKEGALGPNITSNGIHYYLGLLAREGFFKIELDGSSRLVYCPTDKAIQLINMVSGSPMLQTV